MIDEANAICVRETFSVSPRTVKYRPGVLTIRPNPTRDNTQQPMNTSQGRLDDWFGWTFEPPCSLLFPPACAGSVPSLNLTGEPKVSKYLLLLLGKLLLTF